MLEWIYVSRFALNVIVARLHLPDDHVEDTITKNVGRMEYTLWAVGPRKIKSVQRAKPGEILSRSRFSSAGRGIHLLLQ
ncbi:hypothetical protein VTN49DRAFT_4569 [Thermomyces lanuginosus]|uniref:uncharacterized protein n=1 Tax=Thermomyces lanuginosus TaxID=5541 RepID=UPI003741EFD7